MSDQALMRYFGFDQDELTLNRTLHFSDRQQARLRKQFGADKIRGWVFGIGAVLVGAFPLMLDIRQMIAGQDPVSASGWIGGGIWLLVVGGIGVSILVDTLKRHTYRIAKVQGRVNFLGGGKVLPELHIGGVVFYNMQESLVDIMVSGDEYVVYYLTPRQEILSAELMSKAK